MALCYKDQTFCSSSVKDCGSTDCYRYITEEIRKGAQQHGLPIAWMDFRPTCPYFTQKESNNESQ